MEKGVRKIFSEVPETYELVNHVLTFGMDIIWRKKAVKIAVMGGGKKWLDICSGTGETALYLSKYKNNGTMLIAADFSLPMLSKALEKSREKEFSFLINDAKQLPFRDNMFDLITISFATRNLNLSRDILIKTFSEFHRILKPGGRFVNLETSQPRFRLLRFMMHTDTRIIVKPMGFLISGSKAGYEYLSFTIPRFYNADELAGILKESGFSSVTFKRFFFGAAAVHRAVKSIAQSPLPYTNFNQKECEAQLLM